MTKNALFKLAKQVEENSAVCRYLAAALQHTGILQKHADGAKGFVNPAMFARLEVLERGFFGRLKWVLLGR